MKKKVIAITGGIGSGKSTVASYVEALGYPVYSCDDIYNEIYPTKAYQASLTAAFPACVSGETVDRKALAALVFSDKAALQKLNELSHKAIMSALHDIIAAAVSPLVFAEVPLLFEGGFEKDFDFIIVVTRDLEQRLSAISARDDISKDQAMQRIQNQFDYDAASSSGQFLAAPYFLLKNDEDILSLKKKTEKIIEKINETLTVKQ